MARLTLLDLPEAVLHTALKQLLSSNEIIWFDSSTSTPTMVRPQWRPEVRCLRGCRLLNLIGSSILYRENTFGVIIGGRIGSITRLLPSSVLRHNKHKLTKFAFCVRNFDKQPRCFCRATETREHTEAPAFDDVSHFYPLEELIDGGYLDGSDPELVSTLGDIKSSVASIAYGIIELGMDLVHIDCRNIFYHFLEPLRSLRNVRISYAGIPKEYSEFLNADGALTPQSERHKQYRDLRYLEAKRCSCLEVNLEAAWRAIVTGDPEPQQNGYEALIIHNYNLCEQEAYPLWFWTLWVNLMSEEFSEFDATRNEVLQEIKEDAIKRIARWQRILDNATTQLGNISTSSTGGASERPRR